MSLLYAGVQRKETARIMLSVFRDVRLQLGAAQTCHSLEKRCLCSRRFFWGGGGELDVISVCNKVVCGNMLKVKEDAENHVCL